MANLDTNKKRKRKPSQPDNLGFTDYLKAEYSKAVQSVGAVSNLGQDTEQIIIYYVMPLQEVCDLLDRKTSIFEVTSVKLQDGEESHFLNDFIIVIFPIMIRYFGLDQCERTFWQSIEKFNLDRVVRNFKVSSSEFLKECHLNYETLDYEEIEIRHWQTSLLFIKSLFNQSLVQSWSYDRNLNQQLIHFYSFRFCCYLFRYIFKTSAVGSTCLNVFALLSKFSVRISCTGYENHWSWLQSFTAKKLECISSRVFFYCCYSLCLPEHLYLRNNDMNINSWGLSSWQLFRDAQLDLCCSEINL